MDEVDDWLPRETFYERSGVVAEDGFERPETPGCHHGQYGLAHRGVAGWVRVIQRRHALEAAVEDLLGLRADRNPNTPPRRWC